ncbi:MAG: S1C family serine protease [Gemmatimonadetes bacterium]|nr:S1C family serine protease [Gemmatimonadota bacterium]
MSHSTPSSSDATASPTLAAVSEQLATTVEQAARSVVAVHARDRLASTGVHWRDGLIVTTAATVRRDTNISVTVPSGTRHGATLVGRDQACDVAVLRLEGDVRLPPAALGDPAHLRPGHLVLAVARLDDSGPRVAFGAVSSVSGAWRSWKGGEYSRLLQSGLTLYPGFGGTPLVDAAGRVHGLNSGGLSRHFATTIPTPDVERLLSQLLATGYVPRGWLGVAMQAVRFPDADTRRAMGRDGGLLVVGLADGGPAARSGMLVGDILLAMDGGEVHEPGDVLDALERTAPGRTVAFTLLRGGTRVTQSVLVGERPQSTGRSRRRSA